jgi:hypothetical protein
MSEHEHAIVGVVPTSELRSAGTSDDERAKRSTERSSVADLAAAALSRLEQGDLDAVREILQTIVEVATTRGRGVA